MRALAVVALTACGRLDFDVVDRDATAHGFRELCGFSPLTVITDAIAVDDAVGAMLADAVATGCGTAPTRRTVSQDAAGILDATGRPTLAPDDLAVIGGGDGPQRAIAYLLRGDTPVAWTNTAPTVIRERATGRVVASGPTGGSHDYAIVMVIHEPVGGGTVLSASGISERGTTAAGLWFAQHVAPTIASATESWFVVEWSNADSDPAPTDGDTFTVLGGG